MAIIHLKDIIGLGVKLSDRYSKLDQAKAIEAQIKYDLRFDTLTGKIYDNRLGCIEQFSKQSDYVPYDPWTIYTDILNNDFARHINNSASRISRGLTP